MLLRTRELGPSAAPTLQSELACGACAAKRMDFEKAEAHFLRVVGEVGVHADYDDIDNDDNGKGGAEGTSASEKRENENSLQQHIYHSNHNQQQCQTKPHTKCKGGELQPQVQPKVQLSVPAMAALALFRLGDLYYEFGRNHQAEQVLLRCLRARESLCAIRSYNTESGGVTSVHPQSPPLLTGRPPPPSSSSTATGAGAGVPSTTAVVSTEADNSNCDEIYRARVEALADPRVLEVLEKLGQISLGERRLQQAEKYYSMYYERAKQAYHAQQTHDKQVLYNKYEAKAERDKLHTNSSLPASDSYRQCMASLARIYFLQWQYDKAEPLLTDILQQMQLEHGLQHPATLDAAVELATVYLRQERVGEADKLMRICIREAAELWGAGHPQVRQKL